MADKTLSELVQELVVDRRIGPAKADELLRAPRYRIQWRSALTYLGLAILTLGLVRLVVALFEEASKVSIAIALYGVFLVAAWLAQKFIRGRDWQPTAGEVLELIALGSFVAAGALLLAEADWDGEWIAVVGGAVGATWSFIRLPSARFSASLALLPSLQAIGVGLVEHFKWDGATSATLFVAGGALVLVLGQQNVGLAVVLRAAGVVTVVSATPVWLGDIGGVLGLLPSLAVAVLLFWSGVRFLRIEQVVGGAILTVICIGSYVFDTIDNEILQGVIVSLIGALVLGTTVTVLRRNGHHRRYVTTTGA